MVWMCSKLALGHPELGWAEIPFRHASFSPSTIEVDRVVTHKVVRDESRQNLGGVPLPHAEDSPALLHRA